jgi:hypothetical protein
VEYVNIGPSNGASNSHCTIAATATALPPHTMTRDDVKYYLGRVFDIPDRRLEALMAIVDNAQVNKRSFRLNIRSSRARFQRPTRSTSSTP